MAGPIQPGDSPSERVAKLLPAEVTGLYVTVSGLVDTAGAENSDVILLVSTIAIAAAGVFYMSKTLMIFNWTHISLYTVSFFLWVLTLNAAHIDSRYLSATNVFPLLISIITVLWSFIIPLVTPSASLSSRAAGNND